MRGRLDGLVGQHLGGPLASAVSLGVQLAGQARAGRHLATCCRRTVPPVPESEPMPAAAAAYLAEAASSAADTLARHLRGESVEQSADSVAAKVRAANLLFARAHGISQSSGNASAALEGNGTLTAGAANLKAPATLSGTGTLTGGAVLRAVAVLTVPGTGSLSGPSVADVVRLTDSVQVSVTRGEDVDAPATLTDLFAALQVVVDQLDELIDGPSRLSPAEITGLLLSALSLLATVLAYVRPPT